jgi:hypothetical protein
MKVSNERHAHAHLVDTSACAPNMKARLRGDMRQPAPEPAARRPLTWVDLAIAVVAGILAGAAIVAACHGIAHAAGITL